MFSRITKFDFLGSRLSLLLFFFLLFRNDFLVLWKIILTWVIVQFVSCVLGGGSRFTSAALVQVGHNLSGELRVFPLDGVVFFGARVFIFFVDIVSEVHLFFHGLKSASGLVTDAEDSKVVVWIVLDLILL